MENLQNIINNEFNLNLSIEPFGDNVARNNIFLGKNKEGQSFIIKIETLKQLEQVKTAIKIASNLLESDVLSSSHYIKVNSGEFYVISEDKIITIQIKDDLVKLSPKCKEDFIHLGEALGEFHRILLGLELTSLKESDFYKDFMGNEVPLAQKPERLAEINQFYELRTPDYKKLTQGIVHNDLNSNNIFHFGKKYFFIDFELLKKSPLISDIGVLILELWDFNAGVEDYNEKLKSIIEGYEKKNKLSQYDKENIIIFSLRYLFSDENWYNYWSFNGNPAAIDLIPEIRKKEEILFTILS
ncbi:MAG: phosphotransferase [Candidatus Dojkabacteria bacterium]